MYVAASSCLGSETRPLLVHEDGTPLSKEQFVRGVRAALSGCQIDYRAYSGHSFRIGAATAAARAGISEHTI